MKQLEQQTKSNVRHNRIRKLQFAGVAGSLTLIGSLLTLAIYDDTEAVFKRTYTGEGKCLDDTPYDTDQQADIDTRSGTANVVVMPEDPNAHSPSLLAFDVVKTGWLRLSELVPADSHTEAYLAQKNCPNPTN